MLFEWKETDKAKTVKTTSCYFSSKGYSENTAIHKIWELYYCSDYRNYSEVWTDKSSIISPENIAICLGKKKHHTICSQHLQRTLQGWTIMH